MSGSSVGNAFRKPNQSLHYYFRGVCSLPACVVFVLIIIGCSLTFSAPALARPLLRNAAAWWPSH